eukprot:TRINITY_DN111405_c0_g1_i1.p1 TRINITY_DN111405_c0_g1~~TRINITY_DN111405_c0_g1_i1.p1  ORF type:complete len:684 (-),score=141.82 TRINITY_DN111405_c0_g1_i1:195-2246(-)
MTLEPGHGKRRTLPRGGKGAPSPTEKRKRARELWAIVRRAVWAHAFVRRAGEQKSDSSSCPEGLGSLKHFIEVRKLGDPMDLVELIPDPDKLQSVLPAAPSEKSPSSARLILKGPRRPVDLVGNKISQVRMQSARNRQLTALLPLREQALKDAAAANAETLAIRAAAAEKKLLREASFEAQMQGASYETPPDASLVSSEHQSRSRKRIARLATLNLNQEHSETLRNVAGDQTVASFANSLRQNVRRKKKLPETNFTAHLLGGTETAKPWSEQHPLLVAIDSMHDDEFAHGSMQPEQAVLAQRLDEYRAAGGARRAGEGAAVAERRRPLGNDIRIPHVLSKAGAPGRHLAGAAKRATRLQEVWEQLITLMDPQRLGKVPADMFVPLMFWLGLTRRRTAALACLEQAFGPGDIDTASISNLCDYAEVQARLVDGLREMARKESLEQLCEYMTDVARIRIWFYSMKRDPLGHVDIAEVQNLFARMEVTRDRQALFRFLRHELRSGNFAPSSPVAAAPTSPVSALDGGTFADSATAPARTFGITEFASMLCRCTISWCIYRTILLISPSMQETSVPREGILASGPHGEAPASEDGDLALRWMQLQRKITVSLLVNHRFWGREARHVLTSLRQTSNFVADDLTPEQWLALFCRVQAQGMASTLPVGDEAFDPDFLRKKTEHNVVELGL